MFTEIAVGRHFFRRMLTGCPVRFFLRDACIGDTLGALEQVKNRLICWFGNLTPNNRAPRLCGTRITRLILENEELP